MRYLNLVKVIIKYYSRLIYGGYFPIRFVLYSFKELGYMGYFKSLLGGYI